jgi:hypothetical protein
LTGARNRKRVGRRFRADHTHFGLISFGAPSEDRFWPYVFALALQRNATLKPASTFQYLYLSRLSRPPHERCLYRALRRRAVRSMVEIGLGDGRRTLRLLAVAQRYRPQERLSYAAIDLFEARPANSAGWSLKEAHRQLTRAGVQFRLSPGEPFPALARYANSLTNTDLLVIGAGHDPASLEPAWFYIPRMLHEGSLVFVEEQTGNRRKFRRLDTAEILRAPQGETRRRAA